MRKNSLTPWAWLLLLPCLLLPFLGSLFYFTGHFSAGISRGLYLGTKSFTVVVPLLVWLLARELPRFKGSGGVPGQSKGAWPGLFSGLFIGAAILALHFLTPLGDRVTLFSGEIAEKLQDFGLGDHYLILAVILSTLHAGVEEIYWRWLVFGLARRLLRPWMAHVLAALAFTGHHVVVLLAYFPLLLAVLLSAGVFMGGLIWSLMREKYTGLWAPWISHMLVDAAIFFIGWRLLA